MKSTLRTLLLSCILPAAGLHAAAVVYEGFNYATGTFTTSATPTVAATATGLTGNWTWVQNGDANASTTGIVAPTPFRDMQASANALQWHYPTAPGSGASQNFLYAPLSASATAALSVADGQSKTLWLSWVVDSAGAGTPTVELRNNAAGGGGGIVLGVAVALSSGTYGANTVQLLANNASRASASYTYASGAEYMVVTKLTYSKAGTTTSFDSGSVWVLPNTGTLPANEAALGAATASFTTAITSTANRDPSFLRISNNSSGGQNGYDEIRVGTTFSDVVVVTATPPPPPPAGALIWDTFPTSFSNFSAQNGVSAAGLSWGADTGANSLSGRINAAAGPLTEPNPAYHNNSVIYLGAGAEMTKNTADTFTSSVLFLTNEELLPNIAHATTGFLRSAFSAFNTGAGGCAVWGTVRKTATSGSSAVLRLYKTGGQIGTDSASFDLAPSTWYEAVTTMKLASDAVLTELKVAVYSRGADGTAARTLVYSMSATNVALPNGGFTGNIWTGFGGGNYQNQNFLAFDNFAAGTVPQDMVIPALSIQYDAGDLIISCPTQSGFQYQLQSSTSLGGFTDIPGAVLTGNGLVQSFSNQPAPAAGAQKFFRVDVTPL